MADRQFKIEILVEGKNKFNDVAKDITGKLADLEKGLNTSRKSTANLDKDLDGLHKTVRRGTEEWNKFSSQFIETIRGLEKLQTPLSVMKTNLNDTDEALVRLINGKDKGFEKLTSMVKHLGEEYKSASNSLKDYLGLEERHFYLAELQKKRLAAALEEEAKARGLTLRQLEQQIDAGKRLNEESAEFVRLAKQANMEYETERRFNKERKQLEYKEQLFQTNSVLREQIDLLDKAADAEARRRQTQKDRMYDPRPLGQAIDESLSKRLSELYAAKHTREQQNILDLQELQRKQAENLKGAYEDIGHALDGNRKRLNLFGIDLWNIDRDAKSLGDRFREFAQIGGTGGRRGGQTNLGALFSEFRGLGVAFATKNIEALLTTVTGLIGGLISLAGAAISAGAALGGALAYGALSAIGPMTLLFATVGRFVAINKVLNLQQQIKEASLHNKQTKAAKVNTDALGNAQRSLKKAQDDLTEARKRARRELEDLILAERRAVLGLEGSSLDLERAKRAALEASTTGGASEVAEADLGVSNAQLDLDSAKLQARRASADLAQARANGIENAPQVVQAKERIADASRAVANAEQQEATAANAATAAQDRLTYMMKQLTPAERDMVKSINALQIAYKKNFRGITDIIISAAADATLGVKKFFSDPLILAAFKSNAIEGAKSIREITSAFTSGERLNLILEFLRASSENVKPLTKAFLSISLSILRIGKYAQPTFKYLLDGFVKITKSIEGATANTSAMEEFFKDSKKDLEGVVNLAGALFKLFKAIFDPARDVGRTMIDGWAKKITEFAKTLDKNRNAVRTFFSDSAFVTNQFLRVVWELGKAMHEVFNPSAVRGLADFMIKIVIPAFVSLVKTVGIFTEALQKLITLPGISTFVQALLTMSLLGKAFSILGLAAHKLTFEFVRLFAIAFGPKGFGKWSAVLFIIFGLTTAIESLVGKIGMLGKALVASSVFFAVWAIKIDAAGKLALFGFGKSATGLTAKLKAIGTAARAHPYAALAVAIISAAGALLLFKNRNKDAKVDIEKATQALQEQKQAVDDLRLAQQNLNNTNLDYRQAVLNRRQAKDRLDEAKKAFGSNRSKENRNALLQAEIDYERAVAEARRARKEKRDAPSKLEEAKTRTKTETRKGYSEQKTQLEGISINIKNELANAQKIEEKIKKIQQKITSIRNSNKPEGTKKSLISGLTEQLKDQQEKLDDTKNKIKGYKGQFETLAKSVENNAGRFRAGFKLMTGSAENFDKSWGDVISNLQANVNNTLVSFGAEKLNFKSKISKVGQNIHGGGSRHASGGYVGKSGQRGRDTIHTVLGRGEAVLNNTHQKIVNSALVRSGINGLQEVFSKTKGSLHYMAGGGYAGGYMGAHGPVTKAGKAILDRFPGLAVSSGYRNTSTHHGTGSALDISGPLSIMSSAAGWIKASGLWRSLTEGIYANSPFLSVKNNQKVPSSFWGASTWAGHRDHIHIAVVGAMRAFNAAIEGGFKKIKIAFNGKSGAYTKIGKAGAKLMAKEANRVLEKAFMESGSGIDSDLPPLTGGKDRIRGKVSTFGPPGEAAGGTAYGYSSADEGIAVNPDGGSNTWDNARAHKWGRRLARVKIGIKEAILRVIDKGPSIPGRLIDVTGAGARKMGIDPSNFPTDAIGSAILMASGGFAGMFRDGGIVGGGSGRAVPIMAHAGEWILNKGQQYKAAMLAGTTPNKLKSALGFTGGAGSYAGGGEVKAKANIGPLDSSFSLLTPETIMGLAFGPLIKAIRGATKNLTNKSVDKALKSLRDLTDPDNGLFAQMMSMMEDLTNRLASKVKIASAGFTKSGVAVKTLTDLGVISLELANLGVIATQQRSNLKRIQRARRLSTKTVTKARKEEMDAKKELREAKEDDADEKKIKKIKEKIKKANKKRKQAISGRRKLKEQEQEAAALVGETAAEIVAKRREGEEARFNFADKKADFLSRSSLAGSIAAYSLRATNLQNKGAFLNSEIANVQKAISEETDPMKVQGLQAVLEELLLEQDENNLALRENTAQLEATATELYQARYGLTQGIIGGGIQYLTNYANSLGLNPSGFVLPFLNQNASSLQSQRGDLFSSINTFLDSKGLPTINPSLSGSSLVQALVNTSQIDTSSWTQTERDNFYTWLNSIMANTNSIQDNTQAIKDLTSATTQTFTSTAWQRFRHAIFNGSGGLLPQYGQYVPGSIPQMHSGGLVARSGLFELQAGEKVLTKEQQLGNINIEVNQAGESLDPNYLANVLQFKLKNRGY